MSIRYYFIVGAVFTGFLFNSCANKMDEKPLFEILEEKQTGISFSNDLTTTLEKNIFNYLYFYNGGGVGAGDFNNDGLIDLIFSGNQVASELYLNRGNMKFENVTSKSNIPFDSTWCTGVSVVDINNDGMLDIYISTVSQLIGLEGQNKFYICQRIDDKGIPHYEDEAVRMGFDSSGYCTQSAFFDYDMDGDLDMFQLNHSTHKNNTFGQRKSFMNTVNRYSGDRMYRNDNGKFTDVSGMVGINRSSIGYGLGIVVSDINMDGFPDLYIGNDFHENDYYYVNNGNGTFTESLTEQMGHTSRFSMGVDAGDINNDGFPDIISLDMQPEDPFILKKSEGEDALDIFNFKLDYGYNHQYAQNALQLNNRNNTFTEIATYSGIHATDWSWSSLFTDFDNDGWKDLFIANGIPKRMNDIDYINFVSQNDVQYKISMDRMEEKDLELINMIPEIKLYNKFYSNSGDLHFADFEKRIKNNKISYSNGAVTADLDNDGDLDIVCNNINDKAFVYENKTCENKTCDKSSIQINLTGADLNINAVGTKLITFSKGIIKTYEKFPVRGFLSSMETPLVVASEGWNTADSLVIVWPDNTYEKIEKTSNSEIKLTYKQNLPLFDYNSLRRNKTEDVMIEDMTSSSGLQFLHKENPFVEFNREPLIPHAVSNEGPAIAVADVNGDDLEDVYFGNAKWKESELWLQRPNGTFYRSIQLSISADSTYEDVDASFVDLNNDGYRDLVVASGGNEYSNKSEYLLSRVYMNDGKGNFKRNADALKGVYTTASCVVPNDFNGDGFIDLFVGSRAIPWKYGQVPKSYFLLNDGKGNFSDVTDKFDKDKGNLGFVTDGEWADMDGDGSLDLVLSLEWGQVTILRNKKDSFEKIDVGKEKGWWNFVHVLDVDNDGDKDIVAGNLGLNTRFKASEDQPVTMYYEDFDQNDTKEQLVTYFVKGREVCFANILELQKQIPSLKKRFLKAEDFAKATVQELFPK
ncbi:MAG: VCBS repeat-containing protein [Saprospiraceae bacterium]|nr:VCBS repeat-containing protein [Saprospiraceae bacterium]